MDATIQQLNLLRYLTLFASGPDMALALGIYNSFGQLFSFVSSGHQELQTFLDKHVHWDHVAENNGYIAVQPTEHLYFAPMVLGATEKKYWLIAYQQTDTPVLTSAQRLFNIKKLGQISACLIEDYTQIEILTGMASELTVRYEELNLLYGMDDIESFYKNNDEQESLKRLILNCVDYLNIDFAAIYIADQNLFFCKLANQESSLNENLLEHIIRQKLFALIAINQGTLVINRDKDTDWTDADLHLPIKLIAAPIVKANQKPGGVLVLINSLTKADFSNSDRKLVEVLAAEASKLTQSRRDAITGQLNRRGFTEKLEHTINRSQAIGFKDCLLFIDLDQFKVINDTVGQIGGDQLLRQITALLNANLKKDDILGRLGSDEFSVILKHCSLKYATDIADRIRIAIKQFRFLYAEKMFDLSASIGVIELNSDFADYSQAISAADLACTVAKEQGKNRVHVYQKTDAATVKQESLMQWVSRINIGLEENRFLIYRQKIHLLQDSPVQEEHYEILIRLKGENGEILSPIHFIPAAERYNIMPKIDRWVVIETLAKMAQQLAKNPRLHLICAINLSGQSFCEEGFIEFIKNQIKQAGVPAQSICFEITETAAISNLSQAVQFMQQLKKLGCHFSLDDFGSGMSSFTYLKNLPVDYLKIDGHFVKSMVENEIDYAMVNSIHQIGHVMGLKTIAEFVENADIMQALSKIGVDYAQGYHIGKPEPFI